MSSVNQNYCYNKCLQAAVCVLMLQCYQAFTQRCVCVTDSSLTLIDTPFISSFPGSLHYSPLSVEPSPSLFFVCYSVYPPLPLITPSSLHHISSAHFTFHHRFLSSLTAFLFFCSFFSSSSTSFLTFSPPSPSV